jgi:hypothetical protein
MKAWTLTGYFSSVDNFTFYFNVIVLSKPQYTPSLQTTTFFQDYNFIAYLHNTIMVTFLQELLHLTPYDEHTMIIPFHYYINYHLLTGLHHNHQVNMKALSFRFVFVTISCIPSPINADTIFLW